MTEINANKDRQNFLHRESDERIELRCYIGRAWLNRYPDIGQLAMTADRHRQREPEMERLVESVGPGLEPPSPLVLWLGDYLDGFRTVAGIHPFYREHPVGAIVAGRAAARRDERFLDVALAYALNETDEAEARVLLGL